MVRGFERDADGRRRHRSRQHRQGDPGDVHDLPKKPKPVGQDPGVKAYEKSFAIVAHDPEVRSEDVRITKLGPARPAVTTLPLMREDLIATLASRAMNRCLSDKNAKGGTSHPNARVSLGGDTLTYDATISGSAKPGQWRATLNELALELQRARAFGFTSREIEDAKKELIACAERSVETEATTPAQGIISAMNGVVTAGEPIMSPAQRLQLLRDLLPSITTEEASKRFATEFDPKAVCFVAVLPSGDGAPTESELLELGLKALSVQPTKDTEACACDAADGQRAQGRHVLRVHRARRQQGLVGLAQQQHPRPLPFHGPMQEPGQRPDLALRRRDARDQRQPRRHVRGTTRVVAGGHQATRFH